MEGFCKCSTLTDSLNEYHVIEKKKAKPHKQQKQNSPSQQVHQAALYQ
jgi:hypothetical protein